jgi:uncharacterized cupredoxin-like copper-binding protein
MTPWFIALTVLAALGGAPAFAIEEEEVEEAPVRRIEVRVLDYRFEPSAIALTAGESVELALTNEGTVLHEFVIPSFHDLTVAIEVAGVIAETLGIVELELDPGSTAKLRFTPETPGEFPFSCRAKKPKDHFKAGMTGTLIVK